MPHRADDQVKAASAAVETAPAKAKAKAKAEPKAKAKAEPGESVGAVGALCYQKLIGMVDLPANMGGKLNGRWKRDGNATNGLSMFIQVYPVW